MFSNKLWGACIFINISFIYDIISRHLGDGLTWFEHVLSRCISSFFPGISWWRPPPWTETSPHHHGPYRYLDASLSAADTPQQWQKVPLCHVEPSLTPSCVPIGTHISRCSRLLRIIHIRGRPLFICGGVGLWVWIHHFRYRQDFLNILSWLHIVSDFHRMWLYLYVDSISIFFVFTPFLHRSVIAYP